MYKGDGSYKPYGHEIETSLLDLLNKEADRVSKLNEAYRAYDIARKSNFRLKEYEDTIKIRLEKLEETRIDLKKYFWDKLGFQTDVVDMLYNNKQ